MMKENKIDIDWVHPELKDGEIFLMNTKNEETFKCPSFITDMRIGAVAYRTYGQGVVEGMKPLFGKVIPNTITEAVLEVMKIWDKRDKGWWYGYEALEEELLELYKLEVNVPEIKRCLQRLQKRGDVEARPIFKEQSGMLNGSGYFYKF